MLFEPSNYQDQKANITVIGVGGAGNNALNRMIKDGIKGVEYLAINTDAQDLEDNNSQKQLQIGKELTKGLGAGANSDTGKQAAEESKEALIEMITGSDMVFITAGMGGGTGTGAAPVIAKIAREECNALTVGVVTKPFSFEGPKRTKRALEGIMELKKNCDTLLVIPNEVLLTITDLNTSIDESFKQADSILHQATKGISEIINIPGKINLDFADVKKVMINQGDAIMGTGIAHGEERAILAAQQAINSPLLQDVNIRGAKGLLINITGPKDMSIHELNDACTIIQEEAGEDADIISGFVTDNDNNDEIRVTVIATGINNDEYEMSNSSYNRFSKETPLNNLSIDNKSNEPIRSFQSNNDSNEQNDSNEIKDNNILSFGDDDLDVPAFIRNRKNAM